MSGKNLCENIIAVLSGRIRIPEMIENRQPISSLPVVKFSLSTGNIEDIVSNFFERTTIKNSVIATLPYYTTLSEFMSVNDVIAFIPSAIGSLGNFIELKQGADAVEFDIAAAWHRKSVGNPQREWLTERLLKLVTDNKKE